MLKLSTFLDGNSELHPFLDSVILTHVAQILHFISGARNIALDTPEWRIAVRVHKSSICIGIGMLEGVCAM